MKRERANSRMDYLTAFDICLSKDVYHSGETISGTVMLETSDSIRVKGAFKQY